MTNYVDQVHLDVGPYFGPKCILLLEYVIPTPLLRPKKTDLIVDHKNDALSCKFNRSGSQVGLQGRKSAQRAAS